jgi:hypothetical protein
MSYLRAEFKTASSNDLLILAITEKDKEKFVPLPYCHVTFYKNTTQMKAVCFYIMHSITIHTVISQHENGAKVATA